MKSIKDVSIKIKLLVTILIVTLIPLMVAGYLNYQSSYKGIYDVTKKDLNYITQLKRDQLAELTKDRQIIAEEDRVIKKLIKDVNEQYYKENGMDGYGYIIDQNGTLIYHPNDAGKNIYEYEFVKRMIAKRNGYIEYDWENRKKVASFQELPNGWIFAVSSYLEDMMKPVEPIKKRMFIISLLGSVLAIIVGIFIILQITKPIKSVVDGMKKAENGDLTVEVPIYSKDEIGQISIMYNRMMNTLKGILAKVHEASEQVASSSEQLTASANENTKASEQIATSAEEISRGSQNQVERVSEVSHSIHDISSSIDRVVGHVEKVKNDSNSANRYAKEGVKNLHSVISEMDDISHKVKKTETVIRQLGDQSESIMGIITTITDISEQTNLLALNAAIEAARAGEQGKSFAVVAEEVRKLAEQTRNSADEITHLIMTIRDEIKEAIVMMEESSTAVKEGEQVVQVTGQSFSKIETSVDDVTDELESLSEAIHSVNNNVSTIVSHSNEISKLAEVAASDTEEVAAASEEQMATMEEINSSSHILAEMADQLQSQVNRFKVKK